MRPTVHLLLIAAFLALAGGCAGTSTPEVQRELPAAFPSHTVSQIRQHLALASDTLRAFKGQARLTLESPARSGRFSAEVRQRRDDSLYLSISPGLGIEAARVLVTPDSFFVYDRIQRRLTYGALRDARGRLPAPLADGSTFENLLGLVLPEQDVAWALEADSAYYYLESPSGLRTYTVDPALWRVVRYEERAPDGTLIEGRVFSDFGTFDGVYLPRRVVLRRPGDDATASIFYRELTLNPAALSFDLRVNDEAERVLVSRR